jgi:hypothetical protein
MIPNPETVGHTTTRLGKENSDSVSTRRSARAEAGYEDPRSALSAGVWPGLTSLKAKGFDQADQ